MKAWMLILPAALLAAGCAREDDSPLDNPFPENTFSYTVSLREEDAPDTRSVIADDSAISSARVGVYLEGVLINDSGLKTSGTISLGRLSKTAGYSLYAVTGVLASEAFPAREEDLLTRITNCRPNGSYSDFAAFAAVHPDIPMAGSRSGQSLKALDAADGSEDGRITIDVERLFARIRLRVTADSRIQSLFSTKALSGIRIHGAAASIDPFGDGANITWDSVPVWDDGDFVTEGLQFGTVYTLYIPENLQGNIAFTNPSEKNRERLGEIFSTERLKRLTYIETGANFVMSGGDGGEVRYRFYLGSNDTSDFNIRRNRTYDITLSLTYDNIFEGGWWKVDTDGFSDSRELRFTTPPRYYFAGRDAYLSCYYSDHNKSSSGAFIPNFAYAYRSEYAFGTESEINTWLSDNSTLPYNYETVSAVYFTCLNCGTSFPGFPTSTGSERLTFLKELAISAMNGSTRNYFCPICGALWFPDNSYTPHYTFVRDGTPGNSYGNMKIEANSDRFIKLRIPDSASSGDILTYWLSTRDGRIRDRQDLVIREANVIPPELVLSSSTLYPGQSATLTARYLPSGSSVSFSVISGGSNIVLDGSNAATRTVKAVGVGQAVISCTDTSSGGELARLTVTVKAPGILFSTDRNFSSSATSYTVHPDGTPTSVYVTVTDTSGNPIEFRDASLSAQVYSSSRFSLSLPSSGTDLILAGDSPLGGDNSPIYIATGISLQGFTGINPIYDGEFLPQNFTLTCSFVHGSGTLTSSVPVRIASARNLVGNVGTRHIYHERLTEDYYDESGSALNWSTLNYPAINSWVHSASGITIRGEVDQGQYSSSYFDNGLVWRSGTDGTYLHKETSATWAAKYQYPASYTLKAVLTNRYSGESLTWDYAKIVLSEKLPVKVNTIKLQHNSFWQMAKYRLYIDESSWTRDSQYPLPYAFSSKFDCTIHDHDDYVAFLKHYNVNLGSGKKREVRESEISYTVNWDGWEKDFIPVMLGSADISDYVQWFSGDLCFHKKGSPSVKVFDDYTDSNGNVKNYTGIPMGDPVFWLSYSGDVIFE